MADHELTSLDLHSASTEDISRVLKEAGVDPYSLSVDQNGTIGQAPVSEGMTPDLARAALPPLHTTGDNTSGAHLEIGKILGQGGMGVVSEARQVSLDRMVAVKTPRPEGPPRQLLSAY